MTFRFGDRLVAVAPETGEVTLASGATERWDAVIVAEGVGSATREFVLPGLNEPRWMDMVIGYFAIPRIATDDRLWRWYNAPGKRSVSLRPDNHATRGRCWSTKNPAASRTGTRRGRRIFCARNSRMPAGRRRASSPRWTGGRRLLRGVARGADAALVAGARGSRLGIDLLHGALALASRPAVQAIATRFAGGRGGEPALPEYEAAVG